MKTAYSDAHALDAADRCGLCEACGIPIEPERLRALPETRRCRPCKVDDSYAAHAQRYLRADREYARVMAGARRQARR